MDIFSGNEIKERVKHFRQIMSDAGVDYYIIPTSDPHMSEYINPYFESRRFLSGFSGDSGTLVVGLNDCYLWTDGRFFTQAEEELFDTDIELMRAGMPDVPSILEFLENNLKDDMCVGTYGYLIDTSFGIKLDNICKKKKCILKTSRDLIDSVWNNRPDIQYSLIKYFDDDFFGKTTYQKIVCVRNFLKDNNLNGYIFSKLDEIMYLFNIRGMDIPYNPVAVSYAYIDSNNAYLFLNKNTYDEGLNKCAYKVFEIKDYDEIEFFINNEISSNCTVGIDFSTLNYALYKVIQNKSKVVDIKSPAEAMKAVKNDLEIKRIKEFFRLDSAALTEALCEIDININSGIKMDEKDVSDIILEHRSKIKGFICESFPTIAAYKENGAIIHYVPEKNNCKKLDREGMIVIDSGGQYECATTDVTRTISLGELSDVEKDIFTEVTMGMLYLQNAIFAKGCTGRNLDILARERLWRRGLNFNHGTGHGVGCCLNVHEGPCSIRYKFSDNEKNAELKPGMLITDEPGYYEPGKFGIRSENTLLVDNYDSTEYGEFYKFVSLTKVPLDVKCFNKELMDEKDIDLVNQYQKNVYDSISSLLSERTLEWLNERLYL